MLPFLGAIQNLNRNVRLEQQLSINEFKDTNDLTTLNDIRVKNPNKMILCHLNINSIRNKIEAGLYTMGEVIVPQKVQKLSINKDGEAEIVDVVVTGRKYPLLHMRHQILKDHDKYLRLFSDKEYNEMSKEKVKTELMRINEYESAKNLTTVQQLDIESLSANT